ncbi:MAG: hypothetical protein F4X87_11710 [Chloroflexi bacterium]|nr:hypothetical protein [Chloroflexota bacterium]
MSLEEKNRYLIEEWGNRREVMEAMFIVMMDGKLRTPSQILNELPYENNAKVNVSLVWSILESEAKRYVWWDDPSNKAYKLKAHDSRRIPPPDWSEVREAVYAITSYGQRLPASEIQRKLADLGYDVPMWMLKNILMGDDFEHGSS